MTGQPMLRATCVLAALLMLGGAPLAQQSAERFWPQWRGRFATGVSRTATPPLEWSETKNIRWKIPIPGAPIWHTAGLTMNPIPSPVAEDGLAILMSGFRGNSLKAIKLADAKGDITGTPALAWSFDRDTPYVPSPLLYDGMLYMLKGNTGILTAGRHRHLPQGLSILVRDWGEVVLGSWGPGVLGSWGPEVLKS